MHQIVSMSVVAKVNLGDNIAIAKNLGQKLRLKA